MKHASQDHAPIKFNFRSSHDFHVSIILINLIKSKIIKNMFDLWSSSIQFWFSYPGMYSSNAQNQEF